MFVNIDIRSTAPPWYRVATKLFYVVDLPVGSTGTYVGILLPPN